MADPLCDWAAAAAFALSLPDTERSTSYGKPAIKVASNGRAFLYAGPEEDTSFGIAVDFDTIELLKQTDPVTFWQSRHYEGWPAVLARFDSPDPERVRDTIERARDWAAAKKPVRPRGKA